MGRVLIVGAGPGSADLLTLRALKAIETADAVLYDALVGEEVLGLLPFRALRIQTGKRSGRASMAQDTINRLMLRLARNGLTVVRLKGGDPSVFGRMGEERAFLEAHGIAVAIVPGVTAASAAAAQFAFPLTHRGQARRVVLATARVETGLDTGEWRALADPETTAVFYMGRDAAPVIAERLIAAGRSPATPVLAVENAGRAEGRAIPSTLAGLANGLEASGPVLIVVGEVTAQARLGVAEALRHAL